MKSAGFGVAIHYKAAAFWIANSYMAAGFWVAIPVYAAGLWVAIPSLVAGFWLQTPAARQARREYVTRGSTCTPARGHRLMGCDPRYLKLTATAGSFDAPLRGGTRCELNPPTATGSLAIKRHSLTRLTLYRERPGEAVIPVLRIEASRKTSGMSMQR